MRFRPDWVTPCAALPRGLPETVSHQTAAKSGPGGLTALRTADPRRAVTGTPLLRIGSVNRLICHLSNFSNTLPSGSDLDVKKNGTSKKMGEACLRSGI